MMLREKRELKLPNGSEIRSWVNGDQPIPDWLVLHQAGPREPNG